MDDLSDCPYLPDQVARMPLSFPTAAMTPDRLDLLLEAGYRRSGSFFYRTQCPGCDACEPLRLDVAEFQPSRSQRRVWNRGNRVFETRLSPPIVDAERVRLFNLHRNSRQLDQGNHPVGPTDYRRFLLDSPCELVELSLWLEGRLVAVSNTDVGRRSLSAVYCYFDPVAARWSPGTYAILKQIQLARRTDRRWLYLGLYVAANRHLNYKARFLPHQRSFRGVWRNYSAGPASQTLNK
jgi:arginine-tRNA-protein transferase